MKPLVFASYAQFGVNAGDEDTGRLIMAYEPRPTICGDQLLWIILRGWIETCIVAKVMCRVACLE